MATRFYKKKLRDPFIPNKTTVLKSANVVQPVLTSSSQIQNVSPAVITLEKIQASQQLMFAIQNSDKIINFYNNAYRRIIYLLDLFLNDTDMTIIVEYANTLRVEIDRSVAEFMNIPGTSATITGFEEFQECMLGILQNILDEVEYGIIVKRIAYLKTMVEQYKLGNINYFL